MNANDLLLGFILKIVIQTIVYGFIMKLAWKIGGFVFKIVVVALILLFIASFLL